MDTNTTSDRTAKRTKILAKVQKLLTKANDPGATPEEAESFMAASDRLMAEWAIEEAELDATHDGTSTQIVHRDLLIPEASVYRITLRDGLYGIVRAVECEAVYGTRKGYDRDDDGNVRTTRSGKPRYLHNPYLRVYGTPADVEYLEMLWVGLLGHIRSEMDKPEIHAKMVAECGTGIEASGGKLSWRNSFIGACLSRVAYRIRTNRQQVAQEAAGNSLVLASRFDRAREAMLQDYGKLGQANSSSASRSSAGAAAEGRAAGDRASLGGTSFRSGPKGLGK